MHFADLFFTADLTTSPNDPPHATIIIAIKSTATLLFYRGVPDNDIRDWICCFVHLFSALKREFWFNEVLFPVIPFCPYSGRKFIAPKISFF